MSCTRLYPPIWIMEGRVLGHDVIDGYALPRGSTVVLCRTDYRWFFSRR